LRVPGLIDHAHATFADQLGDQVWSDVFADQIVVRGGLLIRQRVHCFGDGGLHQVVFRVVVSQQGFNFTAQFVIAGAGA
jgi:hypothetical protein